MTVWAQSSQRETCPPSAAEHHRAAVLDRRHHLQLAEAGTTGVGLVPCRTMAAENIRDLQSRARHRRQPSARCLNLLELDRDVLQRAHDRIDGLVGHTCVERRILKLGVAEQNLDHPDVGVLLQQMRGEAVP